MNKKLNEMTLEELWQLFPIFLVPHNKEWKNWFLEEKEYLYKLIPQEMIKAIYHIGSTCIPTIMAKNIVDILLIVREEKDLDEAKNILLNNGYLLISKTKIRISLNKGYTEAGFADKVFHIHLRLKDDIDELYFRDYLLEHKEIAQEYEKLKIELSKKYKHNRDLYTNLKTEFIKKYTEEAKLIYLNRYVL